MALLSNEMFLKRDLNNKYSIARDSLSVLDFKIMELDDKLFLLSLLEKINIDKIAKIDSIDILLKYKTSDLNYFLKIFIHKIYGFYFEEEVKNKIINIFLKYKDFSKINLYCNNYELVELGLNVDISKVKKFMGKPIIHIKLNNLNLYEPLQITIKKNKTTNQTFYKNVELTKEFSY